MITNKLKIFIQLFPDIEFRYKNFSYNFIKINLSRTVCVESKNNI